MDARHFDQWSRKTSALLTRRGALGAATALALSGLPVSVLAGKKGGKKKGGGKKGCGKGKKPCGKGCVAKDACCTNEDCDFCAYEVCLNGSCGCRGGGVKTQGVCGIPPTCAWSGKGVKDPDECCSENGFLEIHTNEYGCLPGKQECYTDVDCLNGPCRGFKCPELYNTLTPDRCHV